jgi:hypothetical protein
MNIFLHNSCVVADSDERFRFRRVICVFDRMKDLARAHLNVSGSIEKRLGKTKKHWLALFSVAVICVWFISLSILEVEANPAPHPGPGPGAFAIAFIVAEIFGFIVGTSILYFATREDGQKVILAVILAMTASYAAASILWQTVSSSGLLSGSYPSVLQDVVFILIPEILGTALGTVLIRKILDTRWALAFLAMGTLMVTSYYTAEFVYAAF